MEGQQQQSLSLLARAAALAPQRADLAWLQIQICLKLTACDPEPLGERLRTLDPSNGAGWFGLLARASLSGDQHSEEAALLAISATDRVDIYWTTLISRLTSAAARVGVMSIQEAELSVIGLLSAQDIPTFRVISDACVRGHPTLDEEIQMCRGIARAMERGDTYITEMIGIAIARSAWPETSPDWKAAAHARSVYEYRSELLQHLEVHQPWDRRVAEHYLALCSRYSREQDVVRARLIAAGKKADPPITRQPPPQ
ncbi:MAG TPA: hypothetical protein VGL55_14700 [Steroidobacteraceae bacterium]|jgi:hypothetical protein